MGGMIEKPLILINGAGGFVGSHAVEYFLSRGHRVRATDLPAMDLTWAEQLGAETMTADLTHLPDAQRVLAGVDWVANIAGMFDFAAPAAALYAANVTASENMCLAACGAGVKRFVHVASIAVYGTPQRTPCHETDPQNPKNEYERTKKLGEDVVFRYHRERLLPAMSIRPTVIYGPRSKYGPAKMVGFWALFKGLGVREVYELRGGAVMGHVHVRDVVRAIEHLFTHGEVGMAYNVADETPIAWGEYSRLIREEVGLQAKPFCPTLPHALVRPFGWLLNQIPDRQLAKTNARFAELWRKLEAKEPGLKPYLMPRIDRDFLGYLRGDHVYDTSRLKATGFQFDYPDTLRGLRETIAWYRTQHWVPQSAVPLSEPGQPLAVG